MSEALGVQTIPDNRAGGGTIGVQVVANSTHLTGEYFKHLTQTYRARPASVPDHPWPRSSQ